MRTRPKADESAGPVRFFGVSSHSCSGWIDRADLIGLGAGPVSAMMCSSTGPFALHRGAAGALDLGAQAKRNSVLADTPQTSTGRLSDQQSRCVGADIDTATRIPRSCPQQTSRNAELGNEAVNVR
jgi:hypothetical protein